MCQKFIVNTDWKIFKNVQFLSDKRCQTSNDKCNRETSFAILLFKQDGYIDKLGRLQHRNPSLKHNEREKMTWFYSGLPNFLLFIAALKIC